MSHRPLQKYTPICRITNIERVIESCRDPKKPGTVMPDYRDFNGSKLFPSWKNNENGNYYQDKLYVDDLDYHITNLRVPVYSHAKALAYARKHNVSMYQAHGLRWVDFDLVY